LCFIGTGGFFFIEVVLGSIYFFIWFGKRGQLVNKELTERFYLRCRAADVDAETPTERFFSTSAMFLVDRLKEDREATMTESIGLTSMTAFLDTISNVAFIYDIQSKSFPKDSKDDIGGVTRNQSIFMVTSFWCCIAG